MEYPPELHERDDDYPLDPEVMTIEHEITSEKRHNMSAKYLARVPLQPDTDLLVSSKEALRRFLSAASHLPQSSNEANQTAPCYPL